MVVTAGPAAVRRARLLCNQAMDRPFGNEVVGYNLCMTDTDTDTAVGAGWPW